VSITICTEKGISHRERKDRENKDSKANKNEEEKKEAAKGASEKRNSHQMGGNKQALRFSVSWLSFVLTCSFIPLSLSPSDYPRGSSSFLFSPLLLLSFRFVPRE